jgi:hypothetical protein
MPRAFHTFCTWDFDIPACLAIERTDQCVAPSGGVRCKVSSTIFSIRSWEMVGFGPRPGRTLPTHSMPCSAKSRRQASTVERDTSRCSAITVLATPSAAMSRPLASRTARCGNVADDAIVERDALFGQQQQRCSRRMSHGPPYHYRAIQ